MSSTTQHIIRYGRWFGAALIAGLVTALCQQASLYQARKTQFETALQWSQQITSQAEGLFLDARQRGEPDPVGWVITHLSQGAEPRVMKIMRLDPDVDQANFQLRADQKIYEAVKFLGSDGVSGIKVQIEAPVIRYLGVQSSFMSDLLLGVSFLFCLSFLLLITSPLVREKNAGTSSAEGSGALNVFQVQGWIKEARTLLSVLGARIRDLISQARDLAKAGADSRDSVERLRSQLHRQLEQIRESRNSVRQMDKLTHQSEAVTLNLVIEAARLGPDAQNIVRMCEEVHVLLKKLRAENAKNSEHTRQIEIDMEPLVTDADQAYHAYESIFTAASEMDAQIRKTTEALISQAQHIKALGRQTEVHSEGPVLKAVELDDSSEKAS